MRYGNCSGGKDGNGKGKCNNRSLRPSGFTPAFGRAVAPSARCFFGRAEALPFRILRYGYRSGGKDGNGNSNGNSDSDDNGNSNSNDNGNSNGNSNRKRWLVDGIHSHLSRDETAAKMGHPFGWGCLETATAIMITTATAGLSLAG